MSYSEEQVGEMLARARGLGAGVRSLAASVGQGEGGSRESQLAAQLAFWQIALGLTTLEPGEEEFARGEALRLERELASVRNPITRRTPRAPIV